MSDGDDFTIYETPHFGDDHLLFRVERCVHDIPSLFEWYLPAYAAVRVLQKEEFEGAGCGGEVLAFEMHKTPLAHDREAFDIEDIQALRLQFQLDGYTRDQGYTKASNHALFDGAVIAHLHADLERHTRLLEG